MILFLCFVVISFLGVFPLCLSVFHLHWGLSLLISFGAYILLHVLHVLFFSLLCCSIPSDRPIEKQPPLLRFGVAETAALLCFYGRVRAEVVGQDMLPKEGRFLFVCNHRSMFDPMIAMDKLRDYNISFISKPENMSIPLVGHCLHSAGFLSIDRDNDRNALKTILTAADYMKRDVCSIGVYPEGTRSKTEALLPFHAGCLKAAQRAKVPIVVAAVRGTEQVQRLNIFAAPKKVYLDILDIIPADRVCAQRTEELSEEIRGRIQNDLTGTSSGEV